MGEGDLPLFHIIMFNFFNKKPEDTLRDLREEYDVMDTREPEEKDSHCNFTHCNFTVGFDDSFNTVLKLHQENGFTATLNLNKPATERLIRLLQATMVDEEKTEP